MNGAQAVADRHIVARRGFMNARRRLAQAAVAAAGAVILLTGQARSTDLTGAWANDAALCDKIFITKGNKTSFRAKSDIHGSGFIIEGHRIRGRTATCNVVKTKIDAALVNMLASCATDVMLSTQQLTLRVENENEVTRLFPGLEDLEIKFRRCPKP
jgi:hypothetical protein